MPRSFDLRPVVDGDDAFLCRLYGTTRADEMAATGWDRAQVDAFMQMQWTAQTNDYRTRYPQADHDLVIVDGDPVGRIWVDRGPDEIRLLDIALLPDLRSQGIGTELLTRLQDEARTSGRRLAHAVVKENEDALRLYTALGFVILPEEHPTHWFMEWKAATH